MFEVNVKLCVITLKSPLSLSHAIIMSNSCVFITPSLFDILYFTAFRFDLLLVGISVTQKSTGGYEATRICIWQKQLETTWDENPLLNSLRSPPTTGGHFTTYS